MAHFAELDEINKVIRVIVVDNDKLLDENGNESEQKGIEFLESFLPGKWVQTSYNSSFRKNFAGPDFYYDENRDAFIPTQKFPSWTLNEETCLWEPPVPMPEGHGWIWNEESMSWISRFENEQE